MDKDLFISLHKLITRKFGEILRTEIEFLRRYGTQLQKCTGNLVSDFGVIVQRWGMVSELDVDFAIVLDGSSFTQLSQSVYHDISFAGKE